MLLWKLPEYLGIIAGQLDLMVNTGKYNHTAINDGRQSLLSLAFMTNATLLWAPLAFVFISLLSPLLFVRVATLYHFSSFLNESPAVGLYSTGITCIAALLHF